ncbi:MAG: hypothetical protein SFX18_12315 [Pirellulales bacterium]|nr:hypothetical protein [Pirellulales bacterium]
MTDYNLTQEEAKKLLFMEKVCNDEKEHLFPQTGGALSLPLFSLDHREEFVLDLSRGRIDLAKVKYQNRARQVVVLARLDLAGPPHRNPDGVEIPCPHLHLYRVGFGDKWAEPLPEMVFANPTDLWQTLQDFYKYCHIMLPPRIQPGLFL